MKILQVVAAVTLPCWMFALPARAERLTVDEAVQRALEASDLVRATRARQDAAAASANSARGRALPGVFLSDEQQHYDKPFNIQFGPASFTARNTNTNTFVASAQQPLLGLFHVGQDIAAAYSASDSAEAQTRIAQSAIREAVRSGYLRYFQAKAQEDIARTSQLQLADQMSVAQSKFKAGVLTTADLLRLQVAEANAHQQQIQAQVQGQVARANLLFALGRAPNDGQIEFAEPVELENAALPKTDSTAAQGQALSRRPEVVRADAEARAAHHQKNARLFDLLPEVNLEAAYVHIHGQIFAPESSAYVGIKAEWPIWTWGSGYYAQRAAAANASAASLVAEDERRQVSLDADTKLALAQASAAAVEVANAAIASAEEAYRVTDALVKAGSATTTDLLDAQSALTQAKLNLVRARYEQAIALVALDRATGN